MMINDAGSSSLLVGVWRLLESTFAKKWVFLLLFVALHFCVLRLSKANKEVNKFFPCHGANRVVSTVHAVVAVFWSLSVLLSSDSRVPIGGKLTKLQQRVLEFSFGYFIYDVLYSASGGEWDAVAHHSATLFGLSVGLSSKVSGTEMCLGLLLTESSTPLLHLRTFLKHAVKTVATERKGSAAAVVSSDVRQSRAEAKKVRSHRGSTVDGENDDDHDDEDEKERDDEGIFFYSSPRSTTSKAKKRRASSTVFPALAVTPQFDGKAKSAESENGGLNPPNGTVEISSAATTPSFKPRNCTIANVGSDCFSLSPFSLSSSAFVFSPRCNPHHKANNRSSSTTSCAAATTSTVTAATPLLPRRRLLSASSCSYPASRSENITLPPSLLPCITSSSPLFDPTALPIVSDSTSSCAHRLAAAIARSSSHSHSPLAHTHHNSSLNKHWLERLCDWIGMLFALIFIVARCVLGPFLTYFTFISPTTPLPIKAGAFGVQFISLFWLSSILRVFVRSFAAKSPT